MKKEVGIFTGKTPEDAFEGAKAEYKGSGALSFEVIEQGKIGGFLGIGAVKAKIVVFEELEESMSEKVEHSLVGATLEDAKVSESEPVKEEGEKVDGESDGVRAVEFLKGLLPLLKISGSVTPVLVEEGEKIIIDLQGNNSRAYMGKHGVILDSLQNLAGAVANIGRDDYKRVVVDCDGYRAKRDSTLAHVARKTAEKAVRLGRKVRLEPMSAYERRIIHATLSENEDVTTESSGKDPFRYVEVIPKVTKAYSPRPRGGYNKNFNRDRGGKFNREGGNRDGRGGYNGAKGGSRGGFNRDKNGGYNRDRGGRFNRDERDLRAPKKVRNYTEEEKAERSKVGGGTVAKTGQESSYKKPSSIVFGTYLGNSKKTDE